MTDAGEERKLSLNDLEEIKQEAHDNTRSSEKSTKFFNDKLIWRKPFCPSQKVLLYDFRLHLLTRKLWSRWIGPYEIFSYGAVQVRDPTKDQMFKVNGHILKLEAHTRTTK